MYDIIARRRLSTVLRYIFDFLPKEETSIHLNTKKAVLSDRRNSDTEPYIMLNIFFVEDIFSPRWAEANKSRRCVLPGLRLSGSGQAAFPLPLFSLTFRFPHLPRHRMRFKTLQCRHGSVTASDNQGAVHCSAFIFRFPANFVSPSALFSPFGFRFLLHHRMRFKTLQYRHGSVTATDKSRRRTLSGVCLPVPGT